jgi:hypothetical protein
MEQVLGTTPFLSPIDTMTYAAACTERLRLGCAVLVTPLHRCTALSSCPAPDHRWLGIRRSQCGMMGGAW